MYSDLSIFLDVFRCRSDGYIRGSKIALVEHTHLVRIKRPNDCMEHTTVVEKDQVIFMPFQRRKISMLVYKQNEWNLPVMGIDELRTKID